MMYCQMHTILYIVEFHHLNCLISYSIRKGAHYHRVLDVSSSLIMTLQFFGKPLLSLLFSFIVLGVGESQSAWHCLDCPA